MVTGPPLAICSLNLGITLPLLPNTLPKRTITNLVPALLSSCKDLFCKPWHTISASRLLAPITLVGLTALSVEISTNFAMPTSLQACASVCVPITLLDNASQTYHSPSKAHAYKLLREKPQQGDIG